MEPTIRIQSRLGKPLRRQRAALHTRHASEDNSPAAQRSADTLARRLALAHYIERLIDAGRLRNYAEAAVVLGITRARMSQLMDLALLPAHVQDQILRGTRRFNERELRLLGSPHGSERKHVRVAWGRV